MLPRRDSSPNAASTGVSLEDLGAAAGVSGPAVYRHFDGKQAVLGALLVGVSEDLLDGGQTRGRRRVRTMPPRCGALVQFHVDFALTNPDVIRVQDRDLDNLADDDRHAVRALQRNYVELWVEVLGRLHPGGRHRRPADPRARHLRPDQLDAAQRQDHGYPRDPGADGAGRPCVGVRIAKRQCRFGETVLVWRASMTSPREDVGGQASSVVVDVAADPGDVALQRRLDHLTRVDLHHLAE